MSALDQLRTHQDDMDLLFDFWRSRTPVDCAGLWKDLGAFLDKCVDLIGTSGVIECDGSVLQDTFSL
ncbi:MAG: hypothetical protein ACYDHP_09530 [Ferrimicrobium sp.]